MKKVLQGLVRLTSKITGKKALERLLIFSAKSLDINLHEHALLQIGAGTNVYLENGSELFFIEHTLSKQFKNNNSPVFFDVGANIGNYSLALKKYIPGSVVYAFEPVKNTFAQLEKNVANVNLYNIGFGNSTGKGVLYNAVNTTVSEIATTHKEILQEVFKSTDQIVPIEFEIDTIDNFCRLNNIKEIDFLKIDVEGNELSVLQGALTMLKNNSIKIIQFEFNTHNVYARVFLKDFYSILNDFEFYRLKQDSLLSLGSYNPMNEIFTAQNMVAVHKTISLV